MNARDLILVSVDDHLVEPPHLFEGRLSARFADAISISQPLPSATAVTCRFSLFVIATDALSFVSSWIVCMPAGTLTTIPETAISAAPPELEAALRFSWAPGTAVPSTKPETVALQEPAALHWMK